MLRDAILQYIDHQEQTYLPDLVAATGHEDLVAALQQLLRSDDHEEVGLACSFIRDVVLMAPRTQPIIEFRADYKTSPLIAELEHLVQNGNFLTRRNAVYTLGKTGATESIPVLVEAFGFWRERDPLILPNLLGEIWWMQHPRDWTLIFPLVTSTGFLTRWAALKIASETSGFPDFHSWRKLCFTLLSDDRNFLVRAEARYLLAEFQFEQRLPNLSGKPERRRQHKEVERLKPELGFVSMCIEWSNHLSRSQRTDFQIEELEAFVVAMEN